MSELHHQSIQTGAEADKKNSLQAEHNQIPTPPLSLLQAMSTSSSLSSTRSTEMLRRGENSALQAQLDQATAKIAELKSKMEKFEEEILSTTRTVLDEINQQQRKASQQATADYARTKQQMRDELAESQKKAFSALEEANSRFEAAKNKFDTELTTWQTQSSELLQNTEQIFSSQADKQEKAYTALHEKLSSLLPEASAVGIAAAFAEEKKDRKHAMAMHISMSYACIFLIFVIAYIYYVDNRSIIDSFFRMSTGEINYFSCLVSFVKLLTLEAPLCWLATFAAKKAHQHQRIYEEYAHKYTAAMTYVGLCKETNENLDRYGEDAIKALTNGFRDAVFFNPSAAIDKKVEMDSPMALVDRLIEKVGQPVAEAIVSSKKQR